MPHWLRSHLVGPHMWAPTKSCRAYVVSRTELSNRLNHIEDYTVILANKRYMVAYFADIRSKCNAQMAKRWQIEEIFVLKGIGNFVGKLSIAAAPNPSTLPWLPQTPKIGDPKTPNLNTAKWGQKEQNSVLMGIGKSWAVDCLLLLSTCQPNPNSLPCCAHCYKCSKIDGGFALCLSDGKFVRHIGGVNPTFCGNLFSSLFPI